MNNNTIIGLSKDELTRLLADQFNQPPFRARQIWGWIYNKNAANFSDMLNIPLTLRQQLSGSYSIARPEIDRFLESSDGTRKWLLKLDDGNKIESVHIPEEDRGAVCISSQVGCTLTCTFCHTGTQKLVRNLTAGEIVMQFLVARDYFMNHDGCVSNIVMMGMGEPLLNYDQVAKALLIIMDSEGVAFSRRKITLSTSGIVPMIDRCAKELGVGLAISLHATRDELRDQIVPINKKYPIAELMKSCRNYQAAANSRRITFEYVMLKDVNDSDKEACELVQLIAGIPAIVNLIPFNPWPNSPYECSTPERIESFRKIIYAAGYKAPLRTPRGQDIMGACGQLRSDSMKKARYDHT